MAVQRVASRGGFLCALLVCFGASRTMLLAESPEVGLGDIRAASVDRRLPPAAQLDGPTAILEAAAGVPALSSPCATPLLLDWSTDPDAPESLRQAGALLLAPPLGADSRALATRDGRFALHYAAPDSVRGPEPGPEMVARFAEALVAARSYVSGLLGYADPSSGPEKTPVYLARLGHGLEGYVVPGPSGTRGGAFIVLDALLPIDRVMPAVLHQVAHLSLLTYGAAAPWWHEATASYLTLTGTGDLEAQREAIQARLASSALPLADDHLRTMQGSLLWPLFLAERTGDPAVVRQVWATAADEGTSPLQAADEILGRREGLGLESAFRESVLWALFTGSRDDGAHFTAGRALPEAPLPTLGPDWPLVAGPLEPVGPLGSIAFRIPGDRQTGSLRLRLHAQGGRPAADLLVFEGTPGARPALVPIDVAEGSGEVEVPWSGVREAWIVLRNQESAPGSSPSRFDLDASLDPYAPFDLASITAEALGRSIVLQWTTAAEHGLMGWNVYRAESPTGPFTRLNGVAQPAYGDGQQDTGYLYVDEDVRPARRYYYVVEGLTTAGLTERSHLASARTRPAR